MSAGESGNSFVIRILSKRRQAPERSVNVRVLVLGRTGLRWGEARALQLRDFAEVPMPMLHVIRNQPEGVREAKVPKSGKGRGVPVIDELLPAIRRFAAGKVPGQLPFTSPQGGQLYWTSFDRATKWQVIGRGRTGRNLRHTAACEWLMQGVPPRTVQAWLGHATLSMTERYLDHLGDFADRSALALLNANAAKALSERAKKLGGLDRFGTIGPNRNLPDRGLSR